MNEIERNKQHASVNGWSPEDFGVKRFDEELVEAVKAFQSERFISETGVVDWRTFKALKAYREQLEETEHQRQRERGLRSLASVEGYDEERVARSNEFVNLDLTRSPMIHHWRERFKGLDPLIVEVPSSEWSEFLDKIDELELESIDRPLALMTSVSPLNMSERDRDRWKRTGDIFDAVVPLVPGVYHGSPIEYAIGQVVSTWSIFGRIRPTFCLPVYSGEDLDEFHRLRRWAKSRSIRGVSILTEPGSEVGSRLREEWQGPIKDVDRVDYF